MLATFRVPGTANEFGGSNSIVVFQHEFDARNIPGQKKCPFRPLSPARIRPRQSNVLQPCIQLPQRRAPAAPLHSAPSLPKGRHQSPPALHPHGFAGTRKRTFSQQRGVAGRGGKQGAAAAGRRCSGTRPQRGADAAGRSRSGARPQQSAAAAGHRCSGAGMR